MGIGDDISNKAEELGGKAKEAIGEATGNEELQVEGIFDQLAAKAKQMGESIKDFAEDAVTEVREFAEDAAENIKEFAGEAAEKAEHLKDETVARFKHSE